MNISSDQAERLTELHREIHDRVEEFKQICRETMETREYQQFKYRTLGHLEPGVSEDTEWVTKYSSIDSLEKVAEKAMDSVESDEDEE